MMSIARSGVFTWTAPRIASQWRRTSDSTSFRSALRYRAMSALASCALPASPRKKTISTRVFGGSTIDCRNAAHGSRPAPTLLERGALPSSAAGLSSVPLRPKNSCRSPVQSVWRPARSANAMRDPNAAFHGLRANIAPVSTSISVVTNCADALRDGPSTHST